MDPWVVKIPWRKKWQPTLVFLPGKFHEYRSLAGYSPWGYRESDITEHVHACTRTRARAHTHTHTHTHTQPSRKKKEFLPAFLLNGSIVD